MWNTSKVFEEGQKKHRNTNILSKGGEGVGILQQQETIIGDKKNQQEKDINDDAAQRSSRGFHQENVNVGTRTRNHT
ncbi:unnamed protein product, partial [Amoebophrya sp. A25]|eukprot:GSA25T00022712001.1